MFLFLQIFTKMESVNTILSGINQNKNFTDSRLIRVEIPCGETRQTRCGRNWGPNDERQGRHDVAGTGDLTMRDKADTMWPELGT